MPGELNYNMKFSVVDWKTRIKIEWIDDDEKSLILAKHFFHVNG